MGGVEGVTIKDDIGRVVENAIVAMVQLLRNVDATKRSVTHLNNYKIKRNETYLILL